MPMTPFHFGPGAALHSLAPNRISFLAFCAANVVVDIEPLYYMATGQFPLHRFFHTYLGVSFVIAFTVAAFAGAFRLDRIVSLPNVLHWKELTLLRVTLGAALGGYSHIALDSVMHADIRPLAPFSDANSLYRLVPLGALHWFCLGLAVIGIFLLGIRRILSKSDML